MDDQNWLAERFEANRSHLRGVAFRMLGSLTEADDAVQEAWIRLSRTDTSHVDNLQAWLTTVVARVCLNMLRSRKTRREASMETHLPGPILSPAVGIDPEQEAMLGDSVGLALLVVLDSLTPAERVAFVLHDVFAVPFEEIAPLVGRTPTAARQLASRARRRVQGAPVPDVDLDGQWAVVDAFLAASRAGDFEPLLAVLDPAVVLRSDGGVARRALTLLVRGAQAVAERAMTFRQFAETSTRIPTLSRCWRPKISIRSRHSWRALPNEPLGDGVGLRRSRPGLDESQRQRECRPHVGRIAVSEAGHLVDAAGHTVADQYRNDAPGQVLRQVEGALGQQDAPPEASLSLRLHERQPVRSRRRRGAERVDQHEPANRHLASQRNHQRGLTTEVVAGYDHSVGVDGGALPERGDELLDL